MMHYGNLLVILYSTLIIVIFSLVGHSILSILKPFNSFVNNNSLLIAPLLGGSFIMALLPTLSYLGIKASVSLSFVILLSFATVAFSSPKFKKYKHHFHAHNLKILMVSTFIPSAVIALTYIKCKILSPILIDIDLLHYLGLTKYLTSGTLKDLNKGIQQSIIDGLAADRFFTFGGYPSASHHITAAFSEIFNLHFYESCTILQPVCISLAAIAFILFIRYYEFDIEVEWLTLTLFLISFLNYTPAWDNHLPLAVAVGPGLTATLFGIMVVKEKFDYKVCILLSIFLAGVCSSYSFYALFMLLPAVVISVYHFRFSEIFKKASITISSLTLLIPFNLKSIVQVTIIYFKGWLLAPLQYLLIKYGILSNSYFNSYAEQGMHLIENPWHIGYIINLYTIFGIPYKQTERFANYLSAETHLFSADFWNFIGMVVGILLIIFIIAGILKSHKKYTLLLTFWLFFIIWYYLKTLGRTYYSFRFAVLFAPFIILFFSVGFFSVYQYVRNINFSGVFGSNRRQTILKVIFISTIIFSLILLFLISNKLMELYVLNSLKISGDTIIILLLFFLFLIPIFLILHSIIFITFPEEWHKEHYSSLYEKNVRRIFVCLLSLIVIACLIGLYSGTILHKTNSIAEDEIEVGKAIKKFVPSGKKLLVLKNPGPLGRGSIVSLLINHKPSGMLAGSLSVFGGFDKLPVWHNNSSFKDFNPENLYDSAIYTPDAEYILAPRLYEKSEQFRNYELVWKNSKYHLFKRSSNTATVPVIPKNSSHISIQLGKTQKTEEVIINNNLYDLGFSPKTLAVFIDDWEKDVAISQTGSDGGYMEKEYHIAYPSMIILPIEGVEKVCISNSDRSISKLGFSAEELQYEIVKTLAPDEVLVNISLK
ncbi:MAG TPA: hypothetical protein ENI35_02500, partial [Candidatus Desulfofervidus auxilii]|nr:hypothetical protein [Candidatus Desulfofervidus auxilii]